MSISYDPKFTFYKSSSKSVAQFEHANAIDNLMCAMDCIRSDISYVDYRLSRFTKTLGTV